MPKTVWPKALPVLTDEQLEAREQFAQLWLDLLPKRFALLERFNHSFPVKLGHDAGIRTLEVGAGIGGHLAFEDLDGQEYHVVEVRPNFCEQLARQLGPDHVHQGNIEERQPFPDGWFDRIVAIHTLEHLPNLPAALGEIDRLLKSDGILDVVLPCEGGLAYSLARSISAQRLFEKTFKMDYTPIIRSEHVNTLAEVKEVLAERFSPIVSKHFPIPLSVDQINICVGMRLKKRRRNVL